MAEFIATAQVKVEPSTVGFEKTLREKLKPILAKPFAVKVVPTTAGFATAMRKSLANLKAVSVPVIPTKLDAFRSAIAAQSVPVEVPVIVNPEALRGQLVAAVAAAEAGVVATVPVAFAGGGPAEVTALNAALTSLTTQMEKLAKAQTAAAKGGQAKDKSDKAQVNTGRLREKIDANLAAAEIALTDAQNAALSTQERTTAATTAATKAKAGYAAAVDLVVAESNVETNALLNNARSIKARIAAEAGLIDDLKARSTQEKALSTLMQRKNALEADAARILGVEFRAITDVNIVEKQRIAASALLTEWKTLEGRATKANATAILDEIVAQRVAVGDYVAGVKQRESALKRLVKEEQKAAAARVAAGKTTTGQLNFARRGAAATALSLLGIRGATLASTGAFLAGAAAASLFAIAVKSAVDLEQELNVFKETAKATDEQLQQVRSTAEELGRDIRLPGISAAEAATAMTSLAKAGLSVEDSIAGATGVLQLSIAANIDLARSTEIVASALNAFGLAGGEAVHVADVLANSANLAQGSIDDMGIAMQQASAVGRQAGLSFEDTATFLTILARAGLRGSDAGTSLRTGLIRLINPSEKAQKILDKLGVSIRDAEGNIRPEVFQNLAAATAGMTKAQRDQTIAQLAGNDAVRAFSIIMRLTTPELINFRQENRKAGSAAALTEARAKGLAGAARGLASNLQTTGIAIGRSAIPALEGLVQGMNSAVLAMSSSDQVTRALTASVQTLSGAWEGVATSMETVGPIALQAASAFTNLALSIGLPELLGAMAAYRIVPALLLGVLGPVGRLASAFAALRLAAASAAASVAIGGTLSTGLLSLRAGFLAAAGGIATFATSVQGVALIAAIAAAGMIYFGTQASALEKAEKSLKDTTDSLSQAMTAYSTAVEAASRSTANVDTSKLARDTAALNVELARSALASSDAAKGSLTRRQLENALAVAIDNQRLAQERLSEAVKKAREDQEAVAVEQRNRTRARQAEFKQLQDFVAVQAAGLTMALKAGKFGVTVETARLALLKNTNAELGKRIVALEKENTVASRDLAKRLGIIQNLQRSLDRLLTPKELRILLNAETVTQGLRRLAGEFGIEGDKAIKVWIDSVLRGLIPFPDRLKAQVQAILDGLHKLFEKAGGEHAAIYRSAYEHGMGGFTPVPAAPTKRLTVKETLGRVAGLERERRRARIAGAGPAEELAFLAEEEQLIRARIARGHLSVAALAKLEAELERVINEQESLNNDITSAEEQAASDAQAAADKQKAAQDKRDQAFLALLGRREQKVLNAQTRAAQTESLTDDLRVNRALKKLYTQQINRIKERIKDKETRNAAIRELQQKNFQLDLDFNALLKQQADRQQALVRERFELDIQFFQTTENRRGEINARKRFIAYLKRLQDDTKKGTLEWRRLRNEIADQEKALKDLKDQTKKRNNAWAELTFTFLQAQQGFAANLLGNLIPLGASHGLVGNIATTGGGVSVVGGSNVPNLAGSAVTGTGRPFVEGMPAVGGGRGTPDQRLLQAQGRAAGVTQPPGGRDQASLQIQLLTTIAAILARMERGSRHPEARKAKVSQANDFETNNHGPGSD